MQDGISTNEILKADEAASFLRLKPGSFRNLVYEGRIPFYRLLGRRSLRFKKSDMEQLLEANNAK